MAAGAVFGQNRTASPLPAVPLGLGPLEALERAVLPALRRPPCLVSFSGGRDSSSVLAVAARAARREGLPLPVPVTLRFPGTCGTDESGWQELVVGSLGLADWHRRDVWGELELLGPLARRTLSRHGLLYPANSHTFVPLLELAAPGSLITGLDGDTLLGGWRWARLAAVLRGRARPEPRDPLRLASALAPVRLRRRVVRARGAWRAAWLTAAGQAAATDAWAGQCAGEPLRWDRRLAWYARLRYLSVAAAGWDAAARVAGTRLCHPFLDRDFLASMARAGGRSGFADRTAAMGFLFGGLLPREVIERPTKATFTQAMWGERTRAFATRWTGCGVDPELVDREALRQTWLAPEPDFRSALALHAAWLDSGLDQREHPL